MKFINSKDRVGSGIVLLASLIYLNVAFDIPTNQVLDYEVLTARTLPICFALIAIVVCLVQIFIPASGTSDETISDAVAGFHWKPCLLLTGLMLLYALTFQFFGFLVGTFLFLFTGFSILKEKRYLMSAAVSGGVAVFMWVVLTQMFDTFLDHGDLYRFFAGMQT
jgi:putative tricarboxylic transport membrane protein